MEASRAGLPTTPKILELDRRIEIGPLAHQFLQEVQIETASLRILMRAFRDETYVEKSQPIEGSGYFQQSLSYLPGPEFLEARAIDSAVLAIFRSFTDLLDRLVAIKQLSNVAPPPSILACSTQEELDVALAALIFDRTNQVAKRQRTLSQKANEIIDGDAKLTALLDNVSWLRRSIEHRKKLASDVIALELDPFDLVSDGKRLAQGGIDTLAAGSTLSLQTGKRTLAFEPLQPISLTRQDVEDIGFTLAFQAATPLVLAVADETDAQPFNIEIAVQPI